MLRTENNGDFTIWKSSLAFCERRTSDPRFNSSTLRGTGGEGRLAGGEEAAGREGCGVKSACREEERCQTTLFSRQQESGK